MTRFKFRKIPKEPLPKCNALVNFGSGRIRKKESNEKQLIEWLSVYPMYLGVR